MKRSRWLVAGVAGLVGMSGLTPPAAGATTRQTVQETTCYPRGVVDVLATGGKYYVQAWITGSCYVDGQKVPVRVDGYLRPKNQGVRLLVPSESHQISQTCGVEAQYCGQLFSYWAPPSITLFGLLPGGSCYEAWVRVETVSGEGEPAFSETWDC